MPDESQSRFFQLMWVRATRVWIWIISRDPVFYRGIVFGVIGVAIGASVSFFPGFLAIIDEAHGNKAGSASDTLFRNLVSLLSGNVGLLISIPITIYGLYYLLVIPFVALFSRQKIVSVAVILILIGVFSFNISAFEGVGFFSVVFGGVLLLASKHSRPMPARGSLEERIQSISALRDKLSEIDRFLIEIVDESQRNEKFLLELKKYREDVNYVNSKIKNLEPLQRVLDRSNQDNVRNGVLIGLITGLISGFFASALYEFVKGIFS